MDTEKRYRKTAQSLLRSVLLVIVALLILDFLGMLLTWDTVKIKWSSVPTSGFPSGPALSVQTIAMALPDQLYAGTWGSGVFLSTDSGASWQPRNLGLGEMFIRSLLVSPDGQVLYAGTTRNGIFRSKDHGNHWEPANPGLPALDIWTIAYGYDRKTLFAGTHGGGIFRSPNGGQSWHAVDVGLDALDVRSIVADPDRHILYAAVYDFGVIESKDGGKTWEPMKGTLPDNQVYALAFSPETNTLLAGTRSAGVFRYDFQQGAWVVSNDGLEDLRVRCIVQDMHQNRFLIGTLGGVFASDDGGVHWAIQNDGLNDLAVRAILTAPDGALFVGTDGAGLSRRLADEQAWQPVNRGLEEIGVMDVIRGPDEQTVFAGTFGGGVYQSSDSGETWRTINVGLDSYFIKKLYLSSDRQYLFAAGYDGQIYRMGLQAEIWSKMTGFGYISPGHFIAGQDGDVILTTRWKGMFLTHDHGDTWTPIRRDGLPSNTQAIAFEPETNTLIAGFPDGIFALSPDHSTWNLLAPGLGDNIVELIYNPNPASFFAATDESGVFRSDDGGRTWKAVNDGIQDLYIREIKIDPQTGRIYVGTFLGDIYFSDDQGEHWQRISQNLTTVRAIVPLPGDGLLVGTDYAGLLVSHDKGRTWSSLNAQLTSMEIARIDTNPKGDIIFAMTTSAGVFRSFDQGTTWEATNRGIDQMNLCDLWFHGPKNKLYASYGFSSKFSGPSWRRDCDQLGLFVSENNGDSWKKSPADSEQGNEPLQQNQTYIVVDANKVYLTRTGIGLFSWARYEDNHPEAFVIHEGMVTMYSSAGAGTMLKADVPLPIVWHAPTVYIKMVMKSWMLVNWVMEHSILILLITFVGILAVGLWRVRISR